MYYLKFSRNIQTACQDTTLEFETQLSSQFCHSMILANTILLECMYILASTSFASTGSLNIITFSLAAIFNLDWFINRVHHTTQQIHALQNCKTYCSVVLQRSITDHCLFKHTPVLKGTCQMAPTASVPNS